MIEDVFAVDDDEKCEGCVQDGNWYCMRGSSSTSTLELKDL